MTERSFQVEPVGASSSSPARAARTFQTLTLLCACALLAFACALAVAPTAHAKTLEAPTTVADDITRLHVNKLDADTHEPVIGATMVIVDENGNTVAEWVSDGSTFKIEKGLDVDIAYTLKELNAPEGYGAISPITFTVDPIEGNGIIINSGDESEYDLRVTFNSLQEGVQSTLNLYDQAGERYEETVVTQTRPTPESPTRAVAPQTGDEAPLTTVAILVVAGILAIVLLQIPKRRIMMHERGASASFCSEAEEIWGVPAK